MCKPLKALRSSPRVSYEHIARSPIPSDFRCNCLLVLNDKSDFKNHLFISSLYADRMRNSGDNLITSCQENCWSMLVREQNNTIKAFESRYCFPRNLLYAAQNKSKLFQSNRSLEGMKDMHTSVILVAGSANTILLVFSFAKPI